MNMNDLRFTLLLCLLVLFASVSCIIAQEQTENKTLPTISYKIEKVLVCERDYIQFLGTLEYENKTDNNIIVSGNPPVVLGYGFSKISKDTDKPVVIKRSGEFLFTFWPYYGPPDHPQLPWSIVVKPNFKFRFENYFFAVKLSRQDLKKLLSNERLLLHLGYDTFPYDTDKEKLKKNYDVYGKIWTDFINAEPVEFEVKSVENSTASCANMSENGMMIGKLVEPLQ